jgi:cation diffusion facilitator family transporter
MRGVILTDFLMKLFYKENKSLSNVQIRDRYGKFASIAGIASNLFLFLIKITIGTLFNSISITADAVNNLSDSGASLVTLMGFKMSGKPADEKHPYGHARMENVAGLIVSLIILFLGLQLIKTSVDKIISPGIVEFSIYSVIVLVIAILIKLWQCLFYRKIAGRIHSTTLYVTSTDSRNDIIATSAVLLSAVVSYFSGFNLDGYMGVIVAIIIIISGIQLVIETVSLLLGLAPSKEFVNKIYKKIMTYDNIIGLHDLTVHTYGSGQFFASVHCEVPAEQDIMVSHDIIDNIERDFLKEQGIHMVIHLDPVVTNDKKVTEVKNMVQDEILAISPDISIHDFRAVWGVTHSNLIFDVVVPFEFKWNDKELIDEISKRISQLNPAFYAVITVDHDYTPQKDDAPKI